MTTYENAPATAMLATDCAICGRPLVDAQSVELGIGPECRKRHGFNAKVSDEARAAANKLVHGIALKQNGIEVLEAAAQLRALGFDKLAGVIEKRKAQVVVTVEPDGMYAVKTPYNEDVVWAFRSIKQQFGGRWDGERKLQLFAPAAKAALFETLIRFFAGAAAMGPKGPFVIAAAVKAAAPKVALDWTSGTSHQCLGHACDVCRFVVEGEA